MCLHFSLPKHSTESWLSAQSYCKRNGGDLPVLRHFEYMYYINNIAKPWPVYLGLMEVSLVDHIDRHAYFFIFIYLCLRYKYVQR